MKLCVFCLVFVLHIQEKYASTISKVIMNEGHAIVKRFAGSNIEFTSHEVADVLYEKEPGSFHRISKRELKSVTENGDEKRIRLDVPSGSILHLNLKKRSLFDKDTEFYDNTESGQVKREVPVEDCYAAGDVEIDGSSDGFATVAFCDGLHGSAISNGIEYYIHPVENSDGKHQVHVLRRQASDSGNIHVINPDNVTPESDETKGVKRGVTKDTYKTATGFVIEMAIFVDFRYYAQLQALVPGREDEYVLLAMSATQAMYGDKEKVGYDVLIKVKLYINWKVDPQGYVFEEHVQHNRGSFCRLIKSKYKYDTYFLYTGITNSTNAAVGVAVVNGMCNSCAAVQVLGDFRYVATAHELGHLLGFKHHNAANCPDEVKSMAGGFMGGKSPLNFSPCNKLELKAFFQKGKGQCLFEETRKTLTSDKYINLPSLFPGQVLSPNEQCQIKSRGGEGYTHYRPFDLSGDGECLFFTCINLNKSSHEYLRVERSNAFMGYPCGDELACNKGICKPWENSNIGWDADYLRNLKETVSWSDWSQDWSECSSKCGTGVQFKQRKCNLNEDVFINMYCQGPAVKARLCNTEACPGETLSDSDIRQKRGDEICSRFKENNVVLNFKGKSTYLAKSQQANIVDKAGKYLETKSCFLTCERDPKRSNYLDAIYPDGTHCTDSEKNPYLIKRFGIQLRCVQGVCTEFSDCPGNAKKDKCGICGGDPVHCITKRIDSAANVEGKRKLLALIPTGSRFIDIEMKWKSNKGVTLELMAGEAQHVFGPDGLFKNKLYGDNNPVTFAGTKWTYSSTGYIRSDGPTDQVLIAMAFPGKHLIRDISVTYLEPEKN